MQAIVTDKLNERMTYTQNGRRKTAPRREVLGERLINDALNGKPAAVKTLLQLEAGPTSKEESSSAQLPSAEETEARDRAILASARALGYLPSGDGQ